MVNLVSVSLLAIVLGYPQPAVFGVVLLCALFVWLISRTFSANEQYFSLTINQTTVLSAMAYQPNEQGVDWFQISTSCIRME